MSRWARMIVPGAPHHVTQRGNRREPVFLEPGDEAIYLDLMSERLKRHGVACWASRHRSCLVRGPPSEGAVAAATNCPPSFGW